MSRDNAGTTTEREGSSRKQRRMKATKLAKKIKKGKRQYAMGRSLKQSRDFLSHHLVATYGALIMVEFPVCLRPQD